MQTRSIDEVYQKNAAAGEKLTELLGSLDKAKLNHLPDGEKWTIANIVEHVSLVEANMIRICAKLLNKSESDGLGSDGNIGYSETFSQKAAEIGEVKLEAPEIVHPTGDRTIEESITQFAENQTKLLELKPIFEKIDSTTHKFPHPFLGELSAGEWLTIIGGHKLRHMKQIENLAGRV